MGNKEAKFKQAFEEIDTSKDHKVSARECMIFMDPEKNPKVEEIFLGLTMAEIKTINLEFSKIIENDMDEDGRLSFEEFFQVMKSNKKLNKIILKIADA